MTIKDIHGSHTVDYNRLIDILPYNGHLDGLLNGEKSKQVYDIKGSPSTSKVYYSYVEEENEVYLNYHMLYAFDSKDALAEEFKTGWHNFDRESFTIVFDKISKKPKRIILAGHLKDNTLSLLKTESSFSGIQSWKTGRIFLNYEDMITIENHPVITIARGAHAIYPVGSYYYVDVFLWGVVGAKEKAGVIGAIPTENYKIKPLTYYNIGRKILINKTPNQTDFNTYSLERLDLSSVSNNGAQGVLAFSGYFVDGLGTANGNFPPFTGRELKQSGWVKNSNISFDWTKTVDVHKDNLRTLNVYISKYLKEKEHKVKVNNEYTQINDIKIIYNNIEIPFKSFSYQLEDNIYHFVDAKKFLSLFDTITNYTDVGGLISKPFYLKDEKITQFEIAPTKSRSILRDVYISDDEQVFAHIRYLIDEYNKCSKKQIELQWDEKTQSISIKY